MLSYVATIGLSLTHAGWAIFGNTQVGPILTAKFGWSVEEEKLYLSLIGNISILGLGIGSIFGGFFIAKGRRLAIFYMSVFIYVGVGLTLIRTIPTIMVGRGLCGFAAGVFNMINAKCIFESVPAKYAGIMGCSTNINMVLFGLICSLLGMSLPADATQMPFDQMWRLVYGFPLIFMTLQLLLCLVPFKAEPIDFCIQKGDDAGAMFMIEKVFRPKDKTEDKSKIFTQYL
jgi:hypothetical protein